MGQILTSFIGTLIDHNANSITNDDDNDDDCYDDNANSNHLLHKTTTT